MQTIPDGSKLKILKKYSKYITHTAIIVLLVLVLYKRIPTFVSNYNLENTQLESAVIRRISGEEISVPDLKKNKIIIFWATWCEACHYEMRKLNEMISKGELKPEDLIAVSLDNNKDEVLKFVEKENYQFLVAHDFDGSVARKFKIAATPTIIFINKNSTIDWVSTGVTPSLEKRVKDFLIK